MMVFLEETGGRRMMLLPFHAIPVFRCYLGSGEGGVAHYFGAREGGEAYYFWGRGGRITR